MNTLQTVAQYGRFEVVTNGSRYAVVVIGSAPEAISFSKRYSYGNAEAAILMAQHANRQGLGNSSQG